MGKRKKSSRKPQGPKKKEPLATSFPCLFCNHEKSVLVKLDKKAGTGELSCKVCGQQFQTGINYLSAGVDVYSDWIDACDSVAKEADGPAEDEGVDSYHELALGELDRGSSQVQPDRLVASALDGKYSGQGDYNED